jgi:hypothetical protein
VNKLSINLVYKKKIYVLGNFSSKIKLKTTIYVNTNVTLVDGRLDSHQSYSKHRCEVEAPAPAGI